MLVSLGLIMILGFFAGKIFERFKLPNLLGMICVGMILSPYDFNLLDPIIYDIAPALRQIALVIILTRAGLSLNVDNLKQSGRPALLLCFVPALFEILAVMILAPLIFNISVLDAALMGSVLAAVSPAIVVPRMLSLMQKGYGRKHQVPQMMMAGASLDDIFVIVLFTSFTTILRGGSLNVGTILNIPFSIITGLLLGIIVGKIVGYLFRTIALNPQEKTLVILGISFLMLQLESYAFGPFTVSVLLAILTLSIVLAKEDITATQAVATTYNHLWVGAEILLFVLVGTTVDVREASAVGFSAVVLILMALVIRMVGVYVSVSCSNLTKNEKLFCMIAYTPKATVQAAIGAIPLAMGIESGPLILAIAVSSILVTAPLGAIGIDWLHPYLLKQE